jgi:hypothetical protein
VHLLVAARWYNSGATQYQSAPARLFFCLPLLMHADVDAAQRCALSLLLQHASVSQVLFLLQTLCQLTMQK